jgi:cell wall-associated NlpC family hydrolase
MALDGITGVQARIAEIQAQISGVTATGPASTAASSAAASPMFASLLESAMASGIGNLDPSNASSLSGSGSTSLLSQLTQFAQTAQGTAGSGAGLAPGAATTTNATTQKFLSEALAQRGKPYIYAATASTSDPNPPAFDCSELTKWAAARAGTPIPDGATAQYLYLRDRGATISVDQALHTPGALLFHFGHEPRDLGDIPADGHVAISLGDGVHTIEARGRKYGTNVFEATGNRAGFFNRAGMIPGMT